MPLIDTSRILNNLVVLAVLGWVFFMVYSKMDKDKVKALVDNIKGMFKGKEEK